jgi:hypothetical protein
VKTNPNSSKLNIQVKNKAKAMSREKMGEEKTKGKASNFLFLPGL